MQKTPPAPAVTAPAKTANSSTLRCEPTALGMMGMMHVSPFLSSSGSDSSSPLFGSKPLSCKRAVFRKSSAGNTRQTITPMREPASALTMPTSSQCVPTIAVKITSTTVVFLPGTWRILRFALTGSGPRTFTMDFVLRTNRSVLLKSACERGDIITDWKLWLALNPALNITNRFTAASRMELKTSGYVKAMQKPMPSQATNTLNCGP
mmetsp:Transcript_2872/g.9030  ORF Transcript_2872/g.9030 Transcript_2872/m.9030 type:complete len:207 (+) Transcript_2872:1-621(+)